MKKIITTLLVLAVAAAGAYFILTGNKKKNQEQVDIVAKKNSDVSVRTALVSYQTVDNEFSVNGNFIANAQAQISSEMAGQLIALYVKEGSYVKVGQVIGKMKGDKLDVYLYLLQ